MGLAQFARRRACARPCDHRKPHGPRRQSTIATGAGRYLGRTAAPLEAGHMVRAISRAPAGVAVPISPLFVGFGLLAAASAAAACRRRLSTSAVISLDPPIPVNTAPPKADKDSAAGTVGALRAPGRAPATMTSFSGPYKAKRSNAATTPIRTFRRSPAGEFSRPPMVDSVRGNAKPLSLVSALTMPPTAPATATHEQHPLQIGHLRTPSSPSFKANGCRCRKAAPNTSGSAGSSRAPNGSPLLADRGLAQTTAAEKEHRSKVVTPTPYTPRWRQGSLPGNHQRTCGS